MNLGQSVLAILALVVITFLVVSANRIVANSLQDELKGEAFDLAGDIANDVMNEALKKKFDDPTVVRSFTYKPYWWSSPVTVYYKLYDFYNDTTDFTKPVSLGPTSSEKTLVPLPDTYPYKSFTGYDDFDDYNGYQRIVNTQVMSGFVVKCIVSYVASNNLTTPYLGRTYYKRLLVKITQPTYLTDTLYFSTVMTY
jgi:hypothetical protein